MFPVIFQLPGPPVTVRVSPVRRGRYRNCSEMKPNIVGVDTHQKSITPYSFMRFRYSFLNVPVHLFAHGAVY